MEMIPPPLLIWVNAQENVELFSADVNWQFHWIVLKFSLSFSHFFLSFILFFLSFIHSAFIVTYQAEEWPFHWASNRQAGERQHNKRQRAKTVRRLFICTTPSLSPVSHNADIPNDYLSRNGHRKWLARFCCWKQTVCFISIVEPHESRKHLPKTLTYFLLHCSMYVNTIIH